MKNKTTSGVTCPCKAQSLLVLSTVIFPEHQGQGDKPGNAKWRCKSLYFTRWPSKMGAAARIYLLHSGFSHESSFSGQHSRLCLGLTAPWTHLSEHRLARHARPPAALAPPVILIVPIVSGQHRWWCPEDCHLWNTRGGWTFFCRVSYGSHFLVFPRHSF